MPGFDGTGPMGAGPMTGGARGMCNPAAAGYRDYPLRGYGWDAGFGRGYGRGFGRGRFAGRGYGFGMGRGARGWPGWYPPQAASAYPFGPEYDLDQLRQQAEAMKNSLNAIERRIAEIEHPADE